MSAIIALSGFATAAIVLLIERTVSKHDQRIARNEGYLRGYRDALTFRDKTNK